MCQFLINSWQHSNTSHPTIPYFIRNPLLSHPYTVYLLFRMILHNETTQKGSFKGIGEDYCTR